MAVKWGDDMANRFFDRDEYPREIPRRVLALFDQADDERLYFEALDADWFEQMREPPNELSAWGEIGRKAPLAILEIRAAAYARKVGDPDEPAETDDDDESPRNWVEVGLAPGGGDGVVYPGLFAEGVPIGLEYVKPVSAAAASTLEALFDLTPYEASGPTITSRLNTLRHPVEWVAVYDVGQGSANALCDVQGFPMMYFDMGGGVLANTSTFPAAFTNFCFTQDPSVVMSHWDWDHWSMAARFPDAVTRPWLVPNQKLGAVHGTFAASILGAGTLLVWPKGLRGLSLGQARVEKCIGSSGRNHSGLALLVDGPGGEPPIMLTGDARYTAIPSGVATYHAVVVPHHGADMKNRSVPPSTGDPASRAAYSYGPANSFSHPRQCTFDRHVAQGWPHRCNGPARAVDRHTADLRPALGHIGLSWSARASLPHQPCGGNYCSLQLAQN